MWRSGGRWRRWGTACTRCASGGTPGRAPWTKASARAGRLLLAGAGCRLHGAMRMHCVPCIETEAAVFACECVIQLVTRGFKLPQLGHGNNTPPTPPYRPSAGVQCMLPNSVLLALARAPPLTRAGLREALAPYEAAFPQACCFPGALWEDVTLVEELLREAASGQRPWVRAQWWWRRW